MRYIVVFFIMVFVSSSAVAKSESDLAELPSSKAPNYSKQKDVNGLITIPSQCYGSSCTGQIKTILVNQGDIYITLDVPVAELQELACAAGRNYQFSFRIPRSTSEQRNYDRMYDLVLQAKENQTQVFIGVFGSAYNCLMNSIRIGSYY